MTQEAEVKLAPELLRGVDSLAGRTGRTREQVLDDLLRRSLAAATLDEVRGRVAAAGGPTEDEALQIARDELARSRQA